MEKGEFYLKSFFTYTGHQLALLSVKGLGESRGGEVRI